MGRLGAILGVDNDVDVPESYSGKQQESNEFKRASNDMAIFVLALSVIFSAVMVFITKLVITPFAVKSYSVYSDVVPVVLTYFTEGFLVFIGVFIAIKMMKVRIRFKWDIDAPFIIGVSSIAIILTNIIIYEMGISLGSITRLFGGYGLALIHAFIGSLASSFVIKKYIIYIPKEAQGGKKPKYPVGVVNLTTVSMIVTIILFVLAHMVIPGSGLGRYIFFTIMQLLA